MTLPLKEMPLRDLTPLTVTKFLLEVPYLAVVSLIVHLFVSVEVLVPLILISDKFAAPSKVIFPFPTVTIISSPLSVVEYDPPEILNVESSLKP